MKIDDSGNDSVRARRETSRRLFLVCVYLVVALGIRFIYLLEFSESPLFSTPLGPDVEEYASWANEIFSGNFLWETVRIHSPLYPYFLASLLWIFEGANALYGVRATQIILGFLAVIPIAGALKLSLDVPTKEKTEKDGKEGVRFPIILIFLLLWAWYPPLIYYLGELTSEVLIVPLLSLSVYCLYLWDAKMSARAVVSDDDEAPDSIDLEDVEKVAAPQSKRSLEEDVAPGGFSSMIPLIGGGMFIGFAILAHPLALFFGIFEFIYYLILLFVGKSLSPREIRGRALAPFVFLVAVAIPVLPVAYYNVAVLGSDSPLQANGGFNLYLGNGPEADGTCRLRPGPEWNAIHGEAEKTAVANGTSKDAVFIGRTFEYIKKHPLDWGGLLCKKFLYVWNWRELTAGADSWPLRYFTSFQSLFKWSFGFCAILALSGFFLNLRNSRYFHKYRHFLLLVAAFWFAQTLLVTSGRYRVGMLPAILVLSAVGAAALIFRFSSGKKSALAGIASLSLAAVIVCVPQAPYHPAKELAEARTLMGEALVRRGFYADAERFLVASAAALPEWSRNYNLLGLSLEKRKKYALAEKAYLKAVGVAPEDSDGYANLATLYSVTGRREKADVYFKMAFSLGNPSSKLHYNYALHCERVGRSSEAVKQYELCLKANPSHRMALNNLGVIAFRHGDYEHAASLFKRSLRFDHDNSGRMVNLAAALFLSGHVEEAQIWLRKALELNPESQNARKLIKSMRQR